MNKIALLLFLLGGGCVSIRPYQDMAFKHIVDTYVIRKYAPEFVNGFQLNECDKLALVHKLEQVDRSASVWDLCDVWCRRMKDEKSKVFLKTDGKQDSYLFIYYDTSWTQPGLISSSSPYYRFDDSGFEFMELICDRGSGRIIESSYGVGVFYELLMSEFITEEELGALR